MKSELKEFWELLLRERCDQVTLRLDQILETLVWFVLGASTNELKEFEKEASGGQLRESECTWRSHYWGQLYGLVRFTRARVGLVGMLAYEARTGPVRECYCSFCGALFTGDMDAWEYDPGGRDREPVWSHKHADHGYWPGMWLTKKEALARFPQLHSQVPTVRESVDALSESIHEERGWTFPG